MNAWSWMVCDSIRHCDWHVRLCVRINHHSKTMQSEANGILSARNNGMETISSKLFHIVCMKWRTMRCERVLCRVGRVSLSAHNFYFYCQFVETNSMFTHNLRNGKTMNVWRVRIMAQGLELATQTRTSTNAQQWYSPVVDASDGSKYNSIHSLRSLAILSILFLRAWIVKCLPLHYCTLNYVGASE